MIADSSILINFARINKLDFLINLYKKIYITEGVYNEVVKGGENVNAPDSKIIKSFIDSKKILIYNLDEKYEDFARRLRDYYYNLGLGECDSIALALQLKNKELLIDEKIGRKVARLHNLKPVGSLRVLIDTYHKNIINESELRDLIDKMIKDGFRIGSDVLSEFWKIFGKIKENK